jgi:hypothetical protein
MRSMPVSGFSVAWVLSILLVSTKVVSIVVYEVYPKSEPKVNDRNLMLA